MREMRDSFELIICANDLSALKSWKFFCFILRNVVKAGSLVVILSLRSIVISVISEEVGTK